MKKGLITTIEITESHIKVLQARNARNNRIVTNANVQPIKEKSDKQISKQLSSMIPGKEARTGEVVGIIPRRSAILKHVSLPSHSDEEVDKMINLQIVNHVPYQREDIVFDHITLGKSSEGYTRVLVIILHKDVVNNHLKILGSADLHPNRLTISSMGLFHWLNFQDQTLKGDQESPTLLINFDEMSCETCFCLKDKMIYSRNINFGARDLKKENTESFVKQLYMTLGTYKREKMGADIGRIILVSTMQHIAILKEKLIENFNVPVESVTPVDNLPCRKDLNLSAVWGQTGLSITSGLGLLFAKLKKSINLLPSELEFTKQSKLIREQWIKTGLALTATIILAIFAYAVDIYQDSNYLNQIKAESDQLTPIVKEAKKKTHLLEFVKEKFENRVSTAELFSELYDITPDKIAFRSFSLDEKGWVTIHGYAKVAAKVNAFQNNLVNSPIFKEVNLQYATKLRIFNEEMTDFKITCYIDPGQKGKK